MLCGRANRVSRITTKIATTLLLEQPLAIWKRVEEICASGGGSKPESKKALPRTKTDTRGLGICSLTDEPPWILSCFPRSALAHDDDDALYRFHQQHNLSVFQAWHARSKQVYAALATRASTNHSEVGFWNLWLLQCCFTPTSNCRTQLIATFQHLLLTCQYCDPRILYCHSSVQTFFNSNLRWWTQVVLAWDPIRGESSRPFSCLARVSYPDMQILNSLAVDLVASVIYDHAARRHALWNFVLVLAHYAIISIVFGGAE